MKLSACVIEARVRSIVSCRRGSAVPEKIGLNAFLADRHVLDNVAMGICERSRQTAKHIPLFCPEYADERGSLYTAAGTRDYWKMLAMPHGAKAAAHRLQRTELLPQFNLIL
jgi:hypothetical protein